MRYFVMTLILGLLFWMLSLPAHSKNEYLGGNWRNCESGHIEPYVEKTERDIDYLDNDDSRDDDELRYGVRFRFKLGFTCNKKFRKQQEERYELEQQIELLKICRKYKTAEMGHVHLYLSRVCIHGIPSSFFTRSCGRCTVCV